MTLKIEVQIFHMLRCLILDRKKDKREENISLSPFVLLVSFNEERNEDVLISFYPIWKERREDKIYSMKKKFQFRQLDIHFIPYVS